ncbi:hypothetical protein GCM10027271_22530 [Saccharopolyspora gloriosae]|uniref:Uncharacterized protein n=1 Tax=Saccharopolyspora gloriosae TaxID=455344 RepID=A0A840NP96_9PSEU|nr:hypothetical protein [Saccharopolyspora gloriosae]MBB5070922.1 hypothetical protein [Saccharopolyspora gloriosae]
MMATTSPHRTEDRHHRRHTGLGPFLWSALIVAAAITETWQSPAERGFALLALVLVGVGTLAVVVLKLRAGDEDER